MIHETDILELRKDIDSPVGYIRAGAKYTPNGWKDRLPGLTEFPTEWFLNISRQPEPPKPDPIRIIVNEVFDERGLKSLSYKDAAIEAISRIIESRKI